KRSAATEKKDRFEECRLPRSVITPDEVVPGMQMKLSPPEASNVLQTELGKGHLRRPTTRRGRQGNATALACLPCLRRNASGWRALARHAGKPHVDAARKAFKVALA